MSQFMSVEISGEMVVDLMTTNSEFTYEVWQAIAERIQMGGMRDDASDMASCLKADHAAFIANSFQDLAEAIREGFNMAHADKQI